MTISQKSPILEAQHLGKVFRASDGGLTSAVEGVSIALEPGTLTCLIGPSGCGKSTVLRMLAGLVKPSEGEIWLDGQPLHRPRRRISIVFQEDNLMPWRSVGDNIALPLQLAGVPHKTQRERVEDMLAVTGLEDFRNQYPAELSGGMAQRVAIARGLVTEPGVLLLDEPFGALDALTREDMWQELLRIWSTTQATVLMVTHSIEEATFLADRVLVMSPRPGQITTQFQIPFPRPRQIDLLADPAFTQLAAKIRAAIQH